MTSRPFIINEGFNPKLFAEIYGTSERQIRRWFDAGAPLENVELMAHFLCARKRHPRHVTARIAERGAELQRKIDAARDPAAAEEDAENLNRLNAAILDAEFGLSERWRGMGERKEKLGADEDTKAEIITRMKKDTRTLAALLGVTLRES